MKSKAAAIEKTLTDAKTYRSWSLTEIDAEPQPDPQPEHMERKSHSKVKKLSKVERLRAQIISLQDRSLDLDTSKATLLSSTKKKVRMVKSTQLHLKRDNPRKKVLPSPTR